MTLRGACEFARIREVASTGVGIVDGVVASLFLS